MIANSAPGLAALLFQLAAVIDCSDGEVARLTFTDSPFGAWLDITLDNLVHMAIFVAIWAAHVVLPRVVSRLTAAVE